MSDDTRGFTALTNWRFADEDLPDVAPGATCPRVIVLQKFVTLHQILVRDMACDRLEIGEVKDVPFELAGVEDHSRIYRLKDLDRDDIRKQLSDTGAASAGGEHDLDRSGAGNSRGTAERRGRGRQTPVCLGR